MEKHENTVFHKFKARLKCATVALMAVNLALAALTLFLAALIHRQAARRKQDGCAPEIDLNQTKPDAGYRRYCFQLSERECLERGHDLKQEHNKTVCCGNLNEHLYGVMAETTSKRLLWDTTKALTLNRVKRYISKIFLDPLAITERPVAHVGILQNGNFTGPDSEAPRVQWEPSGERSFVSGGLIHGGDRLIVTLPGIYYVYTGLQFTVNPHTAPNDAIVAFLYRHVNGTWTSRRKLMMSRESSCRKTRGDVTGPVSLHMAGIYVLRKGDEISVRTVSQSLLHRSPATSYLGMHMV